MLDDAEREHHVECAVRPGQRARLVVREPSSLDDRLQAELLPFSPHDLDELRVGVERADLRDLRLLGEPLRDVTEGAADLQHAQALIAAGTQPGEEWAQEVIAACTLVVEIGWRAA